MKKSTFTNAKEKICSLADAVLVQFDKPEKKM